MTLVFNRKDKLNGAPGLHALIVGVSEYPNLPTTAAALRDHHLGMMRLSSPALAAYRIYEWLVRRQDRLPVPLATCRLLLSASDTELQKDASLAALHLTTDRATWANFAADAFAWRDDACLSPNGATLFYFAGHGIQRTRSDQAMLLHDFGTQGAALNHAVDTPNLFDGMAPAGKYQGVARTQIYFIDACRSTPSYMLRFQEQKAPAIWDVMVQGEDHRATAAFFSAVPGTKAVGIKGEETIFSKALVRCLEGEGGVWSPEHETWVVTISSLALALETQVAAENAGGAELEFELNKYRSDVIVHHLDNPPKVNIVLAVDPADAHKVSAVIVEDEYEAKIWDFPAPLAKHPYDGQLPAGKYRVKAQAGAPYIAPPPKWWDAHPPRSPWTLRLQQTPAGPPAGPGGSTT